jgi:uncharacterized membrane protein
MQALQRLALAAYLALLALCAVWEAWLVPSSYAPPVFWLGIKILPLLFPLLGLFRGKPKVYFLASLLVLAYFSEGVVLAYSHRADSLAGIGVLSLAWLEIVLSLLFFFSAAFYLRKVNHAGR